MKVNIVEMYHSEAMLRIVRPLVEYRPGWVDLTISEIPDPDADVNIHIPWHILVDSPKNNLDIILFTHVNPGVEGKLKLAAAKADHIFAMSKHGIHTLRQNGIQNSVSIITPDVEGYIPRKIKVGIVGTEQPNGRKRSWLLAELAWNYNLDPFHFVILGKNWDGVIPYVSNLGVSVENIKSVDSNYNFYHGIDLLLCTGFVEGGPLPLIEALACGVPVLSPPYGYALDYLPPESIYNSIEELSMCLKEFVSPVMERRNRVQHLTKQVYAGQVYEVLRNICKNAIVCRYDNIPAIIREIKATKLLEVGTGTCERAEVMITAALENGTDIIYRGYDYFRPLSPFEITSEFSKQPMSIGEAAKRLLPYDAEVILVEGDTKETIPNTPDTNTYDFIYIDGGHSWETIESDWENLQRLAHDNTVFVLDDYYPEIDRPVGCQKLVDSLDRNIWSVEFLEPLETWGELKIQMVRVQKCLI